MQWFSDISPPKKCACRENCSNCQFIDRICELYICVYEKKHAIKNLQDFCIECFGEFYSLLILIRSIEMIDFQVDKLIDKLTDLQDEKENLLLQIFLRGQIQLTSTIDYWIPYDGYLYYFCNKYFGLDETFGSALCPLFRIPIFLTTILNFWTKINLILGNRICISLSCLIF